MEEGKGKVAQMVAQRMAAVLLGVVLLERGSSCEAATTTARTVKLALPSVLTSDAVLPAAGASIWGWASPSARVEVNVTGALVGSYSTTAGVTDGAWEVSLPVVTPSLVPSNITVSSGADKLTLERTLFGELILCGGQVSHVCVYTMLCAHWCEVVL